MKKKILVYVIIFSVMFFSFNFFLTCKAEEIPTEETIEIEEIPTQENNEEEEIVEEVTFNDQVKDFVDKWGTPILSAIAGISGSTITIFICKFIVNKLLEKMEEERKKSKKDKDEANAKIIETEKKLEKAKEILEQAEKQFQTQTENFKEIVANQKEILSQDQKFKELIAIMFATTPELMSNGVSSQVLELLNEKEVNENEQ